MFETKFLKFTIPPFIFLFFVLFGIFLSTDGLSVLVDFFNKLTFPSKILEIIIGALISGVGILSIGFIISSATYAILNLAGQLHSNKKHYQKNSYVRFRINFPANYKINNSEAEIMEWLIHSKYSTNIHDHLQNRWDISIINANAVTACLLSYLYIVLTYNWSRYWFCLWSIMILVFYYNYRRSKNDIDKINEFLVTYNKKLQNSGFHKKEIK